MNYLKDTDSSEGSGSQHDAEHKRWHAERLEKMTSLLDQSYQFDAASFEAKNAPSSSSRAFESEVISINPLMMLKTGMRLDLGGQRFLWVEKNGVSPIIRLETPVLMLDTEKLMSADEVVDSSVIDTGFTMSLNEFFHRLLDDQGVSFVAKARLAGIHDFDDILLLTQHILRQ